ncbi:MAG: hypothetical protein SFW67_12155, partial [Myxococcaceae bacterium]|nr:hypothetical protein [Myxococcaceae bacterium]
MRLWSVVLVLLPVACVVPTTRVPCQSNANCPSATWCNADCLCTPLADGETSRASTCGIPADSGSADAGSADAGTGIRFEAFLKPVPPRMGDAASPVALSADGSVLVLGANGRSSERGLAAAGQVLVWRRAGGVWRLSQVLEAITPTAGERLGYQVALSADGTTLLAIAWNASNPGGFFGAVDFFSRQPDGQYSHAFRYTTTAARPPLSPMLGATAFRSLAVSETGDTVALGDVDDCSPGEGVLAAPAGSTSASCVRSGGVSLLVRSGPIWRLQAFVKPQPGTPTNARFGESVALSGDGNLLAVGAPNAPRADRSGSVSLFFRNGTAWNVGAVLPNEDRGSDFGEAVAMSTNGQALA